MSSAEILTPLYNTVISSPSTLFVSLVTRVSIEATLLSISDRILLEVDI